MSFYVNHDDNHYYHYNENKTMVLLFCLLYIVHFKLKSRSKKKPKYEKNQENKKFIVNEPDQFGCGFVLFFFFFWISISIFIYLIAWNEWRSSMFSQFFSYSIAKAKKSEKIPINCSCFVDVCSTTRIFFFVLGVKEYFHSVLSNCVSFYVFGV